MSKLDHIVSNNIKNKDQCNDAIYYKPEFDGKFSLSRGNKDPLWVVNFSLREDKKNKTTIISGLTCLWDIRDTNSMINWRHTKPYKLKMCSNKLEYSTATGQYFTTRDGKVPLFMSEFSISKIILRLFHVDND